MLDEPRTNLWVLRAFQLTALSKIALLGSLITAIGIVGSIGAPDVRWARFFDSFHLTSAHLTAAALGVLSVPLVGGVDRRTRMWLAAALGVYAMGQIMNRLESWLGAAWLQAPSDALVLLFGPLCFIGLVVAIRGATKPATRLVIWLDALVGTLIAAGLTLAIYLPIKVDFSGLHISALIASPVFILSAAAVGFILIVHARPQLGLSPLLFLVSLAVTGVIWTEWNGQSLTGRGVDWGGLNGLISVSAICLGLGAAVWRIAPSTNAPYRRICVAAVDMMPMAAILCAIVAIYVALAQETIAPNVRATIVFVGTGVAGISIIRQSYLLWRLRRSARPAEEARRAAAAANPMGSQYLRIGAWEHDVATGKEVWSREAMEIYGQGESVEANYENFLAAIDPSDRDRARATFRAALASGDQSFAAEYRLNHRLLGQRIVFERGWIERDSSEQALKVHGWSQDVTDLRAIESDLAKSRVRLDLALSSGVIGLWDWNLATGEKFHDLRWAEPLGYRPEELEALRANLGQGVHPDDRAAIATALERHVTGESNAYECEFRVQGWDGEWHWLYSLGRIVERDPQGKPVRLTGTHQDITSRKRAEEALKASQAALDQTVRRYHQFFNNMRNIIVSLGAKGEGAGEYGYDSGGALLLGRDVETLAGTRRPTDGKADIAKWYDSIHPDDRPTYLEAERRRKAEGVPFDLSFRVRHPDTGEIRWMREIAWTTDSPLAGGVYFDSYILDITRDKEIEAALQQNEARYRTAERVALLSHWVSTPGPSGAVNDLRVSYSPTTAIILGVEESAMPTIAADFIDRFVHPSDRESLRERVTQSYRQQLPLAAYQYRIVRPKGEIRYIIAHVNYTYDADGRMIAGFGTIQDVTDRVAAEQALRESEARYRQAERAVRLVHWTSTTPVAGNWRLARPVFSENAEQLLGIPASEISFTHEEYLLRFIHRDDQQLVRATLERNVVRGMDEHSLEYRIVRPDGSIRHVQEEVKDTHDDRGQWISSFGTMLDVTDRKQVEEALRTALQAAESASDAKTQFLANTSHELRTPLNAIIGFSEIMMREMLGPMQSSSYKQYSADIHASAQHLLGIINDLLDLSRVETGHLTLTEEIIEVQPIIASCLLIVGNRANVLGVDLGSDLPNGLPRVNADPRAMKQILLNLLSNAIKFTPRGGKVRVTAAAGQSGLDVIVTDNGIGMSPLELDEVVKPFVQIENWLVRKHEGIGLGLPIAKALIELHGGKLLIESEKGQGTRITMRLPTDRIVG